jgi:hypothetical protein
MQEGEEIKSKIMSEIKRGTTQGERHAKDR